MLSDERLDEIHTMVDAITPGGWHWDAFDEEHDGNGHPWHHGGVGFMELASDSWILNCEPRIDTYTDSVTGETVSRPFEHLVFREPEDAAFIAAAPDLVRELLNALDFQYRETVAAQHAADRLWEAYDELQTSDYPSAVWRTREQIVGLVPEDS